MRTNWNLLIEYTRSSLTESEKLGSVIWVHGSEVFHSCGEDRLCYGRSIIKPFHIKILSDVLEDLTWEEKALSIASHNAEPMHLEVLKGILPVETQKWTQLPSSLPLQSSTESHKEPSPEYNPCSGEHYAILRACSRKKWDLASYSSPDHPYHNALMHYMKKVLGDSWEPKHVAKDGCGLVTMSFKFSELARLYAQLSREKDQDWIWEAMTKHPQLIGGTKRLDSTIMKSCGQNVLAKEGAEGLLGMSVLHPDFPQGLGIVIKLANGYDSQALWQLAYPILMSLGWKIPEPQKLFRQHTLINPRIVPPQYKKTLEDYFIEKEKEDRDDRF